MTKFYIEICLLSHVVIKGLKQGETSIMGRSNEMASPLFGDVQEMYNNNPSVERFEKMFAE
jgi:hypothetical protein